MIAHIVLFSPKANLASEQISSFAASVSETFRSIDAIQKATVGRRVDVDAGYDRSFGEQTYEFVAILEFADRQALVSYLQHPSHAELGRRFWESCERTVITEVELADGRDPRAVELLAAPRVES